MDEDFLLAIRLQAEYDNERARSACDDSVKIVHATSKQAPGAGSARPRDLSVVDPTWELLDPSPDIRALFLQFNDMFFWGKLAGVEVKWSPRMTLCAGVCSYEGRGGLCSVRLSEPLLKLRPRKDLVETLLHEMIHALLFVTHNNKDHDSHGPEFCKHMNRINDLTGAKISVYHSFHDEVDEYRKHWWLCNGPCQKRKPYYGYVKRAMNRPPSAVDPWWSEHQQSCGGTFTKVKEPEKYVQKDVKKDGSSKAKPGSLDGKGKCHGVDIRTIIPFSGTGYKLVETNASGVPPKVQQIGSSSELHKPLPHSPSGPVILNNKSLLPSREKSVSTMGSARKVSVANTNVFINVNGSPIKLPTERTSTTQGQSSTSRIGGFFFPGQKNFSKTSVPSATKPSTSQAKNHVESTGQPAKRPRLEDKKTLDSFFIKSPRGNVLKGELVPKVSRATTPAATATSAPAATATSAPAATATSAPAATATASSTNQQSMKVSCPVCRTAVLESDINQHLDVCLAAC